jgi:hypothetical protein
MQIIICTSQPEMGLLTQTQAEPKSPIVFIKLSTSGRLSLLDYFTPWNQAYLASHNIDLGSGGIMLLPDQSGRYPRLMIGAGKSGLVYLMNRDMMTTGNNHFNANGQEDFVLQTVSLQGGAFSTPAYFNGTIYYGGSRDVLTALSLSNGVLPTVPSSLGPRVFGFPGATPSVSANGTGNGIIWAIQRGNPLCLRPITPQTYRGKFTTALRQEREISWQMA